VTCNNEFVAPAADGELVEGRGDVIKRGRSLVFLRSTLSVGKRVILVSSGVVKLIKP
jgi:acyl-coenzyme A thioesterase PaaI-like protein